MKSKKPILTIFVILLVSFCVVPFLYILIRSLISPYGGFTLDYFYKVFLPDERIALMRRSFVQLCGGGAGFL